LTKRPEQVDVGGELGKAPLHYAALIDNIEAAMILVSNNRLIRSLTTLKHNVCSSLFVDGS
jgi:ankyrin repeat protein